MRRVEPYGFRVHNLRMLVMVFFETARLGEDSLHNCKERVRKTQKFICNTLVHIIITGFYSGRGRVRTNEHLMLPGTRSKAIKPSKIVVNEHNTTQRNRHTVNYAHKVRYLLERETPTR